METYQEHLLVRDREIWLTGHLTIEKATEAVQQLQFLVSPVMKKNKNKDITIYINCNGGSLTDSALIVEVMNIIKSKNVIISTKVLGFVASAGCDILLAGTRGHRLATSNTRIMFHATSWDMSGRFNEVNADMKELYLVNQSFANMLRERTKCNEEQIKELMSDNATWLGVTEALDMGIIDGVI